jgi:hypothetical protein
MFRQLTAAWKLIAKLEAENKQLRDQSNGATA